MTINKRVLSRIFILSFFALALASCGSHFIGVLNPKGIIASEERKLLFNTMALMLIVVLPVIIMSIAFIYHYQISHRVQDYKPNWSHSYFLESLWWGIPCAIIFVLAIITWKKTFEYDPFRPIPGFNEPPMTVQVIALPWKWLFIYPEYNIATINYLEIPVGRQVEYSITTDNVPMSAFFIPQLGSQIYTMTGMRSQLHLVATSTGQFDGMNTQFNGVGFSDMHFMVNVVNETEMAQWVKNTQKSSLKLTVAKYTELLKPTLNDQPLFFSSVPANLFNDVIKLYMNSNGTTHPRASLTEGKMND